MNESAPTLGARDLVLGYGGRTIVDGLSVDIAPGAVTAIVGPNACGKSTLLRGLSRLLTPTRGQVVLDGRDISALKTKDVARRLGLLPQTSIAPEGITVADLVARGRFPHQRVLRQFSRDDERAVTDAMAATGVDALAGRPVDELSGGQRQRVWVAMVLAQQTPVILLDEPTTFLDIAHQIELLDLFGRLNRSQGSTIVAVLHDLNHACRFADVVIAMKDGAIVAQGAPADVITADLVEDVYGLPCRIIDDPESHTPLVIPRVSR
ncbi:MAG: ABC transporter ATP-binding protein [Williamsia herbipolensis]|uniref:Iron complex transport system ATP-binding protein n=1 Tax=Williamsia serinedens TaxID=391736 RepID=A0ABT1GXB4_9NOCA|nr:ABC transporter ATP-binding protein [Williamsia serinedens]MBE7160872.1 ABC transporter ATP-binding protein [Williamsia herbipolensis]MCP2159611.1 iron complex transport system ATP-binding protein [Williamsia serinedens]